MRKIFLIIYLLYSIHFNLLAEDFEFDMSSTLDDSSNIIDGVTVGAQVTTIDSTKALGEGCFCFSEFLSFSQLAVYLIKTPLGNQNKSLNKLKQAIKKDNSVLKEQNAQLDKKINLLKEETLRNKEILFLLHQKNNLQ